VGRVAPVYFIYSILKNCGLVPIIYVKKHSIPTMTHEIIHACTYILNKIGEDISCETDETLCHMVGYTLQQYLDKFWDIK